MKSLSLCSAQHKICTLWLIGAQCANPLQVQMVRDVQAASRKLCHRQLSWFRDERLFKWLEGDRPVGSIVDEIVADFSSPVNPGVPCHSQDASHMYAADWPALCIACASQAHLSADLRR